MYRARIVLYVLISCTIGLVNCSRFAERSHTDENTPWIFLISFSCQDYIRCAIETDCRTIARYLIGKLKLFNNRKVDFFSYK